MEEIKTEEVKTEEVKTEEVKTEEVKTEEVKTEEVKTEEVKTNDDIIIAPSENNDKIEVRPENILIDGVEYLYNHIKSIHTENIDVTNIISIVTELIQLVEKYKNLTGPQKKMLVINVIRKLVNNQDISEHDKNTINIIIENTLPIVIDNLISAINGKLSFNKNKILSFIKKNIICCCK